MKFAVVIVSLTLLALQSLTSVDGKVFLNCELAQQLSKNNVEKHLVPHFICLAGAASQMNSAKTTPMPNKSMSYGLFQINDKEECGRSKKGGICNIKCSDLVNDDIRDDIACARKLFERNGFNNWKQWQQRCKSTSTADKNPALPNLTNCNY